VSRKLFDGTKVTIDGSLGVISMLEFFQHHFSEMGHRDLPVTQNLTQPTATNARFTSHVASAAKRLRSSPVGGNAAQVEAACDEISSTPFLADFRFTDHAARIGASFVVTKGAQPGMSFPHLPGRARVRPRYRLSPARSPLWPGPPRRASLSHAHSHAQPCSRQEGSRPPATRYALLECLRQLSLLFFQAGK
jgi:hypothetical protein